MLNKAFHVNLVMFYTCIQIFFEVSQIEIDYWFINILSNHDIKCVDDMVGKKDDLRKIFFKFTLWKIKSG